MRTEYFLSVATGHPWSECIPNSNNPCRKNACHNLTLPGYIQNDIGREGLRQDTSATP